MTLLKKHFFLFVALQLLFFSSFGQSGVIRFEIQQPSIFRQVGHKVDMKIVLTRKLTDSTWYNRDTLVSGLISKLSMEGIPPGVYEIDIKESYSRHRGRFADYYMLGHKTITNVLVAKGVVMIGGKLVENCSYYKDFISNECPACHRSADVVGICRGLAVFDPVTGKNSDGSVMNLRSILVALLLLARPSGIARRIS